MIQAPGVVCVATVLTLITLGEACGHWSWRGDDEGEEDRSDCEELGVEHGDAGG